MTRLSSHRAGRWGPTFQLTLTQHQGIECVPLEAKCRPLNAVKLVSLGDHAHDCLTGLVDWTEFALFAAKRAMPRSSIMMTLDELFKEFEGKTSLQRDETRKKLVGQEIQIVGELGVIAPEYLGCKSLKPEHSHLSSLHITHAGVHLREQLLEYSSGDIVRMNTQFTGVVFSEYDRWSFALVSLVRLKTRDARVRRAAADARQAEADERRGAMFGFYFLYLLPILTYGKLLAPAFMGSHKRNLEIGDLLLLAVFIPGWNWLMCLLPLMSDDPAERQLFYKTLIGWAIAGGVVFVAVVLGSWLFRSSADVLGEAERR